MSKKLARPESYESGKVVAAMLRKLADEMEKRDDFINCHVQYWFADKERVRKSPELYHGKEMGARLMEAKERL